MTKRERNRQNVINFYKTFVDLKDPQKAMDTYGGTYYRQHNPNVADGCKPFIDFFTELNKKVTRTVEILRSVSENDLVMVHCWQKRMPPFLDLEKTEENMRKYTLTSFDLFRLTEDGKIIEHWDSVQWSPEASEYVPSEPAWWNEGEFFDSETTICSENLIDGASINIDLDKTEENKSLVKRFAENILMDKKFETFSEFISTDLVHHICYMEDGADGYLKELKSLKEKHGINYVIPLRTVGEGNFVAVQSQINYRGRLSVIMEMFRVEDGKIVEIWQALNKNTKLNAAHSNTLF